MSRKDYIREAASTIAYSVHEWRGRSPEFMQTKLSRIEAVIRQAMIQEARQRKRLERRILRSTP